MRCEATPKSDISQQEENTEMADLNTPALTSSGLLIGAFQGESDESSFQIANAKNCGPLWYKKTDPGSN